jgi:Protein-tyrosine phosphatase
MIWQEGVTTIVMLGQIVENGKVSIEIFCQNKSSKSQNNRLRVNSIGHRWVVK